MAVLLDYLGYHSYKVFLSISSEKEFVGVSCCAGRPFDANAFIEASPAAANECCQGTATRAYSAHLWRPEDDASGIFSIHATAGLRMFFFKRIKANA